MIGPIIGLITKVAPGVIGKAVPKVIEAIAGKDEQIVGKPTYQQVLQDEHMQKVVGKGLAMLAKRGLKYREDEKALGKIAEYTGKELQRD